MSRSAAAFVVPAVKRHTATVIIAHGLGDTGRGWMDLAENWRRLNKLQHVKFVFPNAPSIPISVNLGMSMSAWYDMKTFEDRAEDTMDEVGILRSRDYFVSLIKTEMEQAGLPSSRIILGGFSQGGAMSLFTGVTTEHKLAGFFGLSSYLLMGSKIKSMIPADNPNKDTPVFMGHGDSDLMVKYDWGRRTAKALEDMGWKIDFKTYRQV